MIKDFLDSSSFSSLNFEDLIANYFMHISLFHCDFLRYDTIVKIDRITILVRCKKYASKKIDEYFFQSSNPLNNYLDICDVIMRCYIYSCTVTKSSDFNILIVNSSDGCDVTFLFDFIRSYIYR